MFFLFSLFLMALTSSATNMITKEFAEELKTLVDWEVTDVAENIFKGWTEEEVKHILGTHFKRKSLRHTSDGMEAIDLPTSFDSRIKWPGCAKTVKNQGNCGSCWAFAITSHLEDRLCVHSHPITLSPQYLLDCDKYDKCCMGGSLSGAMQFLTETGTPEERCLPYDRKCGVCRRNSCFKYKCKPDSVWYSSNPEETKNEIQRNGPVESAMDVYQDFLLYKGGVYYHKEGSYLGGHAIEVIGWGFEQDLPYWLCKNSWGETFGDKGFFKIAIGECSVNDNMISCQPAIQCF